MRLEPYWYFCMILDSCYSGGWQIIIKKWDIKIQNWLVVFKLENDKRDISAERVVYSASWCRLFRFLFHLPSLWDETCHVRLLPRNTQTRSETPNIPGVFRHHPAFIISHHHVYKCADKLHRHSQKSYWHVQSVSIKRHRWVVSVCFTSIHTHETNRRPYYLYIILVVYQINK